MTETAIYSLGGRKFQSEFSFFFWTTIYEAKFDENEMTRRIYPNFDRDAGGKNNLLLVKPDEYTCIIRII